LQSRYRFLLQIHLPVNAQATTTAQRANTASIAQKKATAGGSYPSNQPRGWSGQQRNFASRITMRKLSTKKT
jgi:hypothetical protein